MKIIRTADYRKLYPRTSEEGGGRYYCTDCDRMFDSKTEYEKCPLCGSHKVLETEDIWKMEDEKLQRLQQKAKEKYEYESDRDTYRADYGL
jgi:hypothetical protein